MNIFFIWFVSLILLLPVSLFGQNEIDDTEKEISINSTDNTKQNEIYNQSPIGLTRLQFEKEINNIVAQVNTQNASRSNNFFGSSGYQNRGGLNSVFSRNIFGVNSIFSHRVQRDFYFVGEAGYFYANSILAPSNLPSSPLSDQLRNVSEVSLFPLYFGFRKGLYLNKTSIRRYYPYIGAGIGTALGIGSNRSQNIFESDFEITPSGYVTAGTEIHAFKKLFIDLGIRYRYLNFANTLGLWKDFSGFSFNVGFGYGFGMRLLR